MEVMHQSHEAVLTILEVLLYDPLYVWTMSPQRACQLQQWRETKADITATDIDIAPSGVDLIDAAIEQKRSGEFCKAKKFQKIRDRFVSARVDPYLPRKKIGKSSQNSPVNLFLVAYHVCFFG